MSNLNEQPLKKEKQIKIKSINLLNEDSGKSTQETNDDSLHELARARKELEAVLKEKDLQIQETEQIIQQAKQNWEEEKKQWIEEAKETGYQAGFKQGEDEGRAAYRELLDEANALSTQAIEDFHTTVEKSDETILNLSVHTAKKILNQQFKNDPDTFTEIVKAAINEIKDQPVISIYLHPSNYQTVLQQKAELVQLLENEAKLSIYTKENIAVHSCLIEHPFGQIDASVDTQLGQIRNALHNIATESRH